MLYAEADLELSMDRESREKDGVSVIIPAFNEEGGISDTVDRLADCLEDCGEDFEIIVINDGSTDDTGDILRERGDVVLVEHERNRGYGASLKTGIRHAHHSLIVIVDADGTYPLQRIPELIQMAQDADMVVGARIGKNAHHPKLRRIPKWFLHHFAQWMTRRHIPDLNSGMRVFRKSIAERFLNILPDGFSFTTTITLAMMTNNYVVRYEQIDYFPRVGRSKIRPIRDTLNFLQLILRTGIYFAPLRVFMPVAAVFFCGFMVTFLQDVINGNLNERTLLLLVASTQLAMFALLADMIDKRTG